MLKIARINKLNDPFEFFSARLKCPEFREKMKTEQEKVSKKQGILCFSENWRSPAQWTHYAHRHSGICMGFEIPEKCLKKIKYVQRRLPETSKIDENDIMEYLTTKFVHWRYEKEYRQFIYLRDAIEKEGLYYVKFSKNMALKTVVLGENFERKHYERLAKALKSLSNKIGMNVDVINSRSAFRTFEIVTQKRNYFNKLHKK